MATTPHYTHPNRNHAGSSIEEVRNEPDWTNDYNYRIGFLDGDDRYTGLTHAGEEWTGTDEREFLARAKKEAEELEAELSEKNLINVREFMTKQEVRSQGILYPKRLAAITMSLTPAII